MTGLAGRDARTEELAANLEEVEARIAAACASAGRPRDELTLIAVTKTFPAEDVRRLAALGVHDVGENRDAEAAPKVVALADVDLCWHFVGQLQTNKARSVATYADVVHSVDRPRLVRALSTAATAVGRRIECLIQVSLDPKHTQGRGERGERGERGGALPDDLPEIADLIEASDGLVLGGVMAIAPLGADPAPAFARLAAVAERLRADHPAARVVSAGMSGDLEAAVAAGATHLRVGTALLGYREPLVR